MSIGSLMSTLICCVQPIISKVINFYPLFRTYWALCAMIECKVSLLIEGYVVEKT